MGNKQSKLKAKLPAEKAANITFIERKAPKEAAGIVFEYWFRQMMPDSQTTISIDFITNIVLEYFCIFVAYRGKFIKENLGKGLQLIDDYQVKIGENSYVSAKLDLPIMIESNMIYYWDVIMDSSHGSLTTYEAIGIVSDQCNNIGACAWGGLIDLYGLSPEKGTNWTGTADGFQRDNTHTRSIKKGERVTLELDCNQSTLSYKVDGKMIYGPMILPLRQAWYPAFGFSLPVWEPSVKIVTEL